MDERFTSVDDVCLYMVSDSGLSTYAYTLAQMTATEDAIRNIDLGGNRGQTGRSAKAERLQSRRTRLGRHIRRVSCLQGRSQMWKYRGCELVHRLSEKEKMKNLSMEENVVG